MNDNISNISEGFYERVKKEELNRILEAADNIDYVQAYLNKSYCFHVEDDGLFCGRAGHWLGHKGTISVPHNHNFVSLRDLLQQVAGK